jgi:TFIIF-interacting CTD phosphatase-like protein
MNNAYCDLVDTGTLFNDIKVFKCSYCGLTLALENEQAQMLCFKKMVDIQNMIRKNDNEPITEIIDTTPDKMKSVVFDRVKNANNIEPSDKCTDDQIEQRLKICNGCEHYKDDACELCGCRIVRENNYMNKLSHKSAACPIDKWGPII